MLQGVTLLAPETCLTVVQIAAQFLEGGPVILGVRQTLQSQMLLTDNFRKSFNSAGASSCRHINIWFCAASNMPSAICDSWSWQ